MYKKIFDKAFSGLSPLTDSKKIAENVIERTNNMKTSRNKKYISFKKPIAIAAAAVFGITAATVSVGAATGWNFNKAFGKIFETEKSALDNCSSNEDFDFSKYGKSLDLHYEFENHSVNIKGIIADETTAYVIYDIIFDEDYDYKPKENYREWFSTMTIDTPDSCMNTYWNEIISTEDNRFTFYSLATGGDEGKTLSGNTLIIDFPSLYRENDSDNPMDWQILECGINVEIPVDFPVYEKKTIPAPEDNKAYLIHGAGAKEFKIDAALEKIELSPFSCNFAFKTSLTPEEFYKDGNSYLIDKFSFTDKNGNEILYDKNSYSIYFDESGRLFYHTYLRTPIAPDEITAITVGGITVPLNNEPKFDFRKYGKELDLHYDFENYELYIKGISADNTTAYILYDVIFDKSFNYKHKDEWTQWDLRAIIDTLEKDGERTPCKLISIDQNTYSFCGMISLKNGKTLEGKTITMDFSDLCRTIPTTSENDERAYKEIELLDCNITAEIPIDFEICENRITKSFSENVKLYDYVNGEKVDCEGMLKSVSVTPFSWEILIDTGKTFGKAEGYYADITFNFSDRTSLTPPFGEQHTTHTENGSLYKAIFTTPITPDQITSITIGSTTIKFN